MRIHCGPEYPKRPPQVRFENKINLRFVDSAGNVKPDLPALANWNVTMGIEAVLVSLKNSMNGNRDKQPSDDARY